MAKDDFEAAQKLQKEGETDAAKWIRLNEQDRVHEEKLASIMANAESLKGKEYIDYLLAFLKGRKEEAPAETSK